MKKNLLTMLMFVALIGLLPGCMDNDESTGTGELKLYLIDAPASYDSVIVVIKEVSVHSENQGWIVVNNTTRTFDLLQLTNGARSLLGEATLLVGSYTQIRLLLDTDNYVVVSGIRHPITIPSGSETGIKLIHGFQIDPNYLFELYLDFDASRSIILQGNGEYRLKPTIRVSVAATTGTIFGSVLPATHLAIITAMSATDTTGTFANTSTGAFRIMALPPAVYNVKFQSTTAVKETTLVGVNVTAGSDTFIGTILW